MEPNRYRHSNHYNRNYQPYNRGPTNSARRPYSGYRRPYNRPPHRQNYNEPPQDYWPMPERIFDDRGREVFDQRPQPSNQQQEEVNKSEELVPKLTPLEEKAKNFLQTVLNQDGIRSKLIFLETVDNALQTLQSTVDYCQMQMQVVQNTSGDFILSINKEELAKGSFATKQEAKNSLAKQVLDNLRQDCFYIIKKNEYEEVSTKAKEVEEEAKASTSFEGSKAHQMMLKMGWGGKGLGLNEQGQEKTVAETIDQNISRQGLGTGDVFKKVHKILEDYSKSDKMSLLKFDPDFSSEERAQIHKIAQKFGLKSKSEGKGEQRRITITKKLHRSDLVYNLLTCGLQSSLYKLILPKKFEYLWFDDEEDGGFLPSFSS